MKTKSWGMIHWLWLTALAFILDQMMKYWVVNSLRPYEQLSVIPSFFSITLTYNRGAAFSLLSDQGGWQRWFFIFIASAVSLMLVIWLYQMKKSERWQACAMSLILGGALGNLVDRAITGRVVDFLMMYYNGWYFPTFNIADTCITLGAFMLILDIFRSPGRQSHPVP